MCTKTDDQEESAFNPIAIFMKEAQNQLIKSMKSPLMDASIHLYQTTNKSLKTYSNNGKPTTKSSNIDETVKNVLNTNLA